MVDKTREQAANYDHSKLKQVETQEKSALPTSAGTNSWFLGAAFYSENVSLASCVENELHWKQKRSFVHVVIAVYLLDIAAEKAPQEAAAFDKEKLHHVETAEKVAMPTQQGMLFGSEIQLFWIARKFINCFRLDIASEKAPQEAANFEKEKLKHVDTVEKTALPTQQGIL